jgi:hypothetical protein
VFPWKKRGEYVVVQNPVDYVTHEEGGSRRPSKKAAGRRFLVTVLRKGDRYGRDDALVYDEDEPQIEVWDQTWANKGGFDDRGQFVSRYYAFSIAEERRRGMGIDLVGYEPAWKIDGSAWGSAVSLAKSVTHGEKAWSESLRRRDSAKRMRSRRRTTKRATARRNRRSSRFARR